jgi:polar amino acid transport system substrate-binding protein
MRIRSLLGIVLGSLGAVCPAVAQTVSISIPLVSGDWKPWVDPNKPAGGVFPRLMAQVGRRMGVTFDSSFKPWRRAEDELRSGTVWAAFPYRVSPEREAEFWFSDPIVKTTMILFTTRDGRVPPRHLFGSLAAIKPFHVGGLLGSWYQDDLQAAGVDVEWTASLEANFQKLRLGRVDVVPAESAAGWAAAKSVFDDPAVLVTQVTAESSSTFRLMVSRRYPGAKEWLRRFNGALAAEQTTDQWRSLVDEIQLSP